MSFFPLLSYTKKLKTAGEMMTFHVLLFTQGLYGFIVILKCLKPVKLYPHSGFYCGFIPTQVIILKSVASFQLHY